MVIDPIFGLEQILAMDANESTPLELYRKTVEENKPVLYSLDGQPIKTKIDDATGQPIAADAVISSAQSPTVAQINLKGTMLSEGGFCTPGIDHVCNQFIQANGNPNILGVVLNTHSGGGEVVAAQRLSNAMSVFQKPIVQFVDGMAASGAYWAGAHSDEVVMGGNTTEIGSIGVVIQMDAESISWLKENLVSIYAEGSEAKHDILKAILSGDHDFVKRKSLNPLRKEFVNVVKKGRPNVSDEALTGTMFTAKEAIKAGLADRIGTRQDAIQRVITLSRRQNRTNSAKKALAYVQ